MFSHNATARSQKFFVSHAVAAGRGHAPGRHCAGAAFGLGRNYGILKVAASSELTFALQTVIFLLP